jgi:hypothetical protein
VKIVRPDRVSISFDGDVVVGDDEDDAQIRFIDDAGALDEDGDEVDIGYLQPGQEVTVRFRFRTYDLDAFSGAFELSSTRGGVVRGTFDSGG